jgi:hypothetical protein
VAVVVLVRLSVAGFLLFLRYLLVLVERVLLLPSVVTAESLTIQDL